MFTSLNLLTLFTNNNDSNDDSNKNIGIYLFLYSYRIENSFLVAYSWIDDAFFN
jgi:hypothetical protein